LKQAIEQKGAAGNGAMYKSQGEAQFGQMDDQMEGAS